MNGERWGIINTNEGTIYTYGSYKDAREYFIELDKGAPNIFSLVQLTYVKLGG